MSLLLRTTKFEQNFGIMEANINLKSGEKHG